MILDSVANFVIYLKIVKASRALWCVLQYAAYFSDEYGEYDPMALVVPALKNLIRRIEENERMK